jgi:hypothetical protein
LVCFSKKRAKPERIVGVAAKPNPVSLWDIFSSHRAPLSISPGTLDLSIGVYDLFFVFVEAREFLWKKILP